MAQLLDGISNWIASLTSWFGNLGWVANAIAIFTAVAALAAILRKTIARAREYSSFRSLVDSVVTKPIDDLMLKKIGDIAIVDDNISDFPIEELRKAGYQIKAYKQFRIADIHQLAKFDVVFLDIHGIVKDDMEAGGLKLIERLREENPRQQICAVSSRTFDPSATSFFKLANDAKKKPLTAQQCAEVIDASLAEKFDLNSLVQSLDHESFSLSARTRRELVRMVLEKVNEDSGDDVTGIIKKEAVQSLSGEFWMAWKELRRIINYAR
jgi:CheY-like chemotaxis protein